MALPEPLGTYRFRLLYFQYSPDTETETTIITGMRWYKDESGFDLLDVPSCITSREVTNQTKDKLWSKLDDLRKARVRIADDNLSQGFMTLNIYIPQRSNENSKDCFQEIRQIIKDKYEPLNISFCVDYIGENRQTIKKVE